jgi:hypothetical protein
MFSTQVWFIMKKNEVNGTAFLFDFLWMACFFHDRAYALIL